MNVSVFSPWNSSVIVCCFCSSYDVWHCFNCHLSGIRWSLDGPTLEYGCNFYGRKFSIGLEMTVLTSTFMVRNNWSSFIFKNKSNQFDAEIGMNGWNIAVYWTIGLAYLVVEMSAWPKWLIRYKIQPTVTIDKKRLTSVNDENFRGCYWEKRFEPFYMYVQPRNSNNNRLLVSQFPQLFQLTLFNQFFVAIPFSIVGYYVLKFQGTSPPIRELPTFMRLVVNLAIFIPIQEFFAYYTHRYLYNHSYEWKPFF